MHGPVQLEFDHAPSTVATMLRALLPRTRQTAQRPLVARWRGHRPDPVALRRWRTLSGLPDGEALPILYPHTFGFRLSMSVLTHPAFPVPIWRVLQVENHLEQHRAIAPDERLDFETATRDFRAVAKGLEVDLVTLVTVRGELVWRSNVTFLARGRVRTAAAPAARSPESPAPPTELGATVATWTMPDDAPLAFGAFTGDYNGIHLSNAYARRFGFERALYHPPRVLGHCLARLPKFTIAAPQRLDAWLKGPVPYGAAATLRAREDPTTGETAFGLFVDPARPCVVGLWRSPVSGAA